MVIYADIKPLIVAGFVLVLINASNSHPLTHQRKARDSGSYGRMTMLKKSCIDPVGNIGICMFKWDCISQRGITLSTCVDGFLFGACCSLKEDGQHKMTFDNYIKSTTDNDNEKNNTISLIKYVTLSYLQQKTTTLVESEELPTNSSPPSTNFYEVSKNFQVDTTTDSLDNRTSSNILHSDSVTINTISSIENFLETVLHSSINSSNIPHIGNQFVNDSVLDDIELDNQKISELDFQVNLINLEIKSEANYSQNNQENWQYDYISSNITEVEENEDPLSFSSLLIGNNQLNVQNESNETEESPNILSTFDFNKFTQSNPKAEKFTTVVSLKLENKNLNLTTPTRHDLLTGNEEILIDEYNFSKENISLNSTKDIENSVKKEISLLALENHTSLIPPPSFQALISQLTSREASNMETSVLPTLQTNLTPLKSNISEVDESELSFLNNTTDISYTLESQNIHNVYPSEESNFLLVSRKDVDNQNDTDNVPSTTEINADDLNSTISGYSFPTNSTNSINLDGISHTGINYNITDTNEKSLLTSVDVNNENKRPSTGTLESDVKYTTKSLNDLSEEAQVSCDKKEDCINYYTSSGSIQYNKLHQSLDSNIDYSETPSHNLNPVTQELDPNLSSLYKIPDESKKITTLSLQFSTIKNNIDDVPSSIIDSNIVSTTERNENFDDEKTDGEIEEIDTFDPTASISSPFINDEFLFDITTDILTYFTKPEENSPEIFESHGSSFILSTNKLEENSIQSEENLITPSQTNSQQLHTSTFDATIDEIMNNLSSLDPLFASTGDYDEFQDNSIMADNTTESDLDGESVINNLVSMNSSVNINFTTSNENNFNETSLLIKTDLNFNTNSSSGTNISSGEDYTNNVINLLNISVSQSPISDNHQETTKLQSTTTISLNSLQNFTNKYIETTTNSLVNMTIPLTTENSSSITSTKDNHPNHHTILTSQSVDILNNTESSSLLYNIHNVTTTRSHNTTAAFNSIFSSISNKYPTIISTTSVGIAETSVKNKVWNYKKDCGVRPMQPVGRIVGGRNTYFGKWPWQALVKEATWLGLFVKNKCGGVLITSKYVLTAAHCQPGFLASLLVVLGTHDISNLKDNGLPVIRNVKRMVVHRHYNPQTFENDLALLEMDTELEFMPHVVPICLPHRNEDFTGEMAFVTGWGKLTHGGDVPNILQEVQVPIVANSECQMMFYQAGHQKAIQNNFVCAGYTNGGQDSCEGDSGGPLMVQRKDKRWVLVGTVSHGIGCADPNLPGVYMRMSSYRPWIDSIINK